MPKGNKGGVTKDDERYGDNSQPKNTNAYDYATNAPPASQGNRNSNNWSVDQIKQFPNPGYPKSEVSGGGESVHERGSYGNAIETYNHNDTHRAPEAGSGDD